MDLTTMTDRELMEGWEMALELADAETGEYVDTPESDRYRAALWVRGITV